MSVEDWARAEAEKQWPRYPAIGFSGPDDRQAAYIAGAAALAERLQSPEAVEAAARAHHVDFWGDDLDPESTMPKSDLSAARAAVAAALDTITKGDN